MRAWHISFNRCVVRIVARVNRPDFGVGDGSGSRPRLPLPIAITEIYGTFRSEFSGVGNHVCTTVIVGSVQTVESAGVVISAATPSATAIVVRVWPVGSGIAQVAFFVW